MADIHLTCYASQHIISNLEEHANMCKVLHIQRVHYSYFFLVKPRVVLRVVQP